MGTRSATGVFIDGQSKLSYNQFDGYWSGVGQEIIDELKADIAALGVEGAVGTWKQKARTMILVNEDSKPTPDQIEKCRSLGLIDLSVSEQSEDDWYCLLRETHGSILKRLNAGFMLDGSDFIKDSLFCEFAYVLNLDEECLELYKGFQTKRHDKGRYVTEAPGYIAHDKTGYWACALVASIPISAIPGIEKLEERMMLDGILDDSGEVIDHSKRKKSRASKVTSETKLIRAA